MQKAPPMLQDSRIYVAGHRGLVGSALLRCLSKMGFSDLICRTHAELDLCAQESVNDFFAREKPEYVFMAAAKVGGIHANATYPADFIRDNMLMQTNVIDAAYRNNCKKLLFLGSSCIYPKKCPQPIKESYLLTGPLEPTNEAYAVAKIAGIKMCQAYRKQYGFDAVCAMPTNLYGPEDNFHTENSHVVPALLRRFHEAKISGASEVAIWGTGTSRREFLYSDDLAEALLFIMQRYSESEHINVGCGEDMTILELARLVALTTGYTGKIVSDSSMPDGTPQKLLDISKLSAMGWKPSIGLEQGLAMAYKNFLSHKDLR